MRIRRCAVGAVLVTACAALAGCNMVVSDKPMLAPDLAAPKLKPGVWANGDAAKCTYDIGAQLSEWPNCANPMIIRPDGTWLIFNRETGEWRAIEVMLGSGDPTVVQAKLPADVPLGEGKLPRYIYLAMRPSERDAAGLVVAIDTWLMTCGPIEKRDTISLEARDGMVTKSPFAGLTVIDGNCRPADMAALLNAAKESEALEDDKGAGRWVMDAPMGLGE